MQAGIGQLQHLPAAVRILAPNGFLPFGGLLVQKPVPAESQQGCMEGTALELKRFREGQDGPVLAVGRGGQDDKL
jgi:hypothetical protein